MKIAQLLQKETKDVENEQSDKEIKSVKIIIQQVKYIETSTKSIFNYKDFKVDNCAAHLFSLNSHQSINNNIPYELFFKKTY